ncbi:MAG: hypothetical protein PVF58_06090 [Candidatus Methanofastidiosia archaeon]|jgi:hypothetical protein
MFDLLGTFISWLKKIFYIRSVLKYERSKKKSSENNQLSKARSGGKFTQQIKTEKVHERRLLEGPKEKYPGNLKISDYVKPRIYTKEETKTGIQKPYKKKSPTKEKNRTEKKSKIKKKIKKTRKKKKIDLGGIKRNKRSLDNKRNLKRIDIKSDKKTIEEKEISTRIESPFVEIDLDKAAIFLVIPQQMVEPNGINPSHQLNYRVEVNGTKHMIIAKIFEDTQYLMRIEEKKIRLEKCVKKLKIVFPDELQGRIYEYTHINEHFYAFIAIGDSKGRMHYLYNKKGIINSLPKKDVWMLLARDFELKPEPNLIEEIWLWGNYRPVYITLKKIDEIIIRNIRTEEKKKISCESTFSIEGKLVNDDFKEQSPLITGESIRIKASKVNPGGRIVWVQNRHKGFRIVDNGWTGDEPLELKLPDSLPCDYGEFQVDICEQGEKISLETLFFRYIPVIQIKNQRELIVPDTSHGHQPEKIKVELGSSFQAWEIKTSEKIERTENGYSIELPPEKDVSSFSLYRNDNPEIRVRARVTIPRLKWKTSRKEWNDMIIELERTDFVTGEDLYLDIITNDFNNRYQISAVLKSSCQLQEKKLLFKGMHYKLLLNEFYDTISQNMERIFLEIKIRKESKEIDTLKILCIPQLEKWNYAYYRKKPLAAFSKKDKNLLNQLFRATAEVLSFKPVKEWCKNGEIKVHNIFKPYIDDIQETKNSLEAETVNVYTNIANFRSFEEQDFDQFFENIKKIILLPSTMYFWIYGEVDIPFFSRDVNGFLFYSSFFDGKKIKWIFEEKGYKGKILDGATYQLVKQAHASLGITEELESFKKEFENPEYRKSLFLNDLYNPGLMKYLIEKWKFFIRKDGSLKRMTIGDDRKFLDKNLMNKALDLKLREYISHPGSLELSLSYRLDFMDKLLQSTEDKKIALADAQNFFLKYWKNYLKDSSKYTQKRSREVKKCQ